MPDHPAGAAAAATALPTRADVAAAAARIAGLVRTTPVMDVEVDGRPVTLKLEQLQVTGSFKVRGATNAIRQLPPDTAGVIAASGGNHGLAVAHAAAEAGVPATLVVPTSSPDLKAQRIAARGAEVVRHGVVYDEAEELALELAERRGLTFVHAFGDPRVIAGQGTLALEARRQAPDCDALVIAVGGGGLIAGCALAVGDEVPVIGAEPTGAPTLHAALEAGGPVGVEVDTATVSSLGARRTAPVTHAVAAAHVAEVVLLPDEAIVAARDWLWEHCRIAVELGAASGLAAVREGLVTAAHPCVVLCGANDAWTPPAA